MAKYTDFKAIREVLLKLPKNTENSAMSGKPDGARVALTYTKAGAPKPQRYTGWLEKATDKNALLFIEGKGWRSFTLGLGGKGRVLMLETEGA